MIAQINAVADGWWSWMGALLWQASLLIVVLGVLDVLLRRWAWPQVRHALWLLVLVKLLLPPAWSLPTSVISWAAPWAQAQVLGTGAAGGEVPGASSTSPSGGDPSFGPGERSASPEPGTAPAASAPSSPAPTWKAVSMLVWIAGMALFAAGLMLHITRLRRWHREQEERRRIPSWFHELLVASARRMGVDRLPAIVFSREAVSPAVYGVFRPVLLLPAGYTEGLSREEAEHVLLHELAHLKRGDLWLHGLWLLLQIVHWYNPLLYWARRNAHHVREICCDLTVASLLQEQTPTYRRTLLRTARELLTESGQPGLGLLGVFEEPFRLVSRLRWLESGAWRRRRAARAAALLASGALLLVLLPMAAAEPAAAGPAAEAIPGPPDGDIYVRDEIRLDSYFLFLHTDSRLLEIEELWIGDGRVALTQGGRTLILDEERNRFLFVNPATETYVEADLPLNVRDLLSEEVVEQRRGRVESGSVRQPGATKKLLGRECRRYDVTLWSEEDGRKRNVREGTVWATTDVPFEVSLFEKLLDTMREIYNRDPRAREELRGIRGIQMSLEMDVRKGIFSQTYTNRVAEISRREAPPGTYQPPEHYQRREQLLLDDF